MKNLVSLLAVAALVSTQCSWFAECAQIRTFNDLDYGVEPVARERSYVPSSPLPNLVRVEVAPPETVSHVSGTLLELNCSAFGYPSPAIYWLKNGMKLPDLSAQSNEIVPPLGPALAQTVSRMATRVNYGDVLTCVAAAGAKMRTANTTVTDNDTDADVQSALAFQELYKIRPHIITYYNQILAEVNYSIVLICRVYSSSPSQVYWEASDGKIVRDNDKMKVLESGDLLIRNLSRDDMGQYRCIVKNFYGKDAVSTFLLPMFP